MYILTILVGLDDRLTMTPLFSPTSTFRSESATVRASTESDFPTIPSATLSYPATFTSLRSAVPLTAISFSHEMLPEV